MIFFISLIFSFRAVTSVTLFLMLASGVILYKKRERSWLPQHIDYTFLIAATLYWLLDVVSLAYTQNQEQGLRHIEKTSGLPVIALAVYASFRFLSVKDVQRLYQVFTVTICVAALYCLAIAFAGFINSGSTVQFFYHQLSQPIGQHAIRFSILIGFTLIWLIDAGRNAFPGWLRAGLVIFLSAFLLLLSSKLVLVFYGACLLVLLVSKQKALRQRGLTAVLVLVVLAGGLFLVLSGNPVKERFRLLASGDRQLFLKDSFNQGTYFNGIQFRLLHWRLVPQILQENKAWWTGLGSGDAQDRLNEMYIRKDMYTGKPGTTDRGLLDYHTHNQFLQSLLQTGIAGLAAFLFICFALVRMAVRDPSASTLLPVLFLLLYCFTDAVLETQYGIVIFSFFPLFSYLNHRFNRASQTHHPGNPL